MDLMLQGLNYVNGKDFKTFKKNLEINFIIIYVALNYTLASKYWF